MPAPYRLLFKGYNAEYPGLIVTQEINMSASVTNITSVIVSQVSYGEQKISFDRQATPPVGGARTLSKIV